MNLIFALFAGVFCNFVAARHEEADLTEKPKAVNRLRVKAAPEKLNVGGV